MTKVFKYELPFRDHVTISMPQGAKILSVQTKGNTPYVWALVDPEKPMVDKHFRFAGTGHPIEEPPIALSFIGTFQVERADWILVFHLFEILSAAEAASKAFGSIF